MASKSLASWLASLVVLLAAGCGGGGGGGGGGDAGVGAAPMGALGVSMTDAPACGFDAVNVTVVKVRVHQIDSAPDTDPGWTDITLSPPRKINLLGLTNGAVDLLGETQILTGHYMQLRLVLDPNSANGLANSVVPIGGAETPLVTPGSVQSGIKVISEFDVGAGQRVDLVLDFDACKSIVKRRDGTYALRPVLKSIPPAPNGIDGYVDLALLGSGVMVTAQQDGAIVQSTAPDPQTGRFFLSRVAPGNYDVVFTAGGHATAVIASVPVASTTSVVSVSDSSTPIMLPVSVSHNVSGKGVLNPASSSEVVYTAAKQTLGATTVTVRSVAADDSGSGAYALTLPVAAPLLGQFGTGALPITLVAQTDVAGKYVAEAGATNYQTQFVAQDIAPADATHDFLLPLAMAAGRIFF